MFLVDIYLHRDRNSNVIESKKNVSLFTRSRLLPAAMSLQIDVFVEPTSLVKNRIDCREEELRDDIDTSLECDFGFVFS